MIRLLTGDCRALLPTLPDESVHCVVTSPPYFGLRDYGTATWEGGDAGCDHVSHMARSDTERETPGGRGGSFRGGTIQFRDECGHCGARRVDSQIGMEETPEHFIAELVAVFRQVRRVLRQDGTVWLNLGDSYASSPPGNKTRGVSAKSGLNGVNGASGQYRETLAAGHATKRDTSKIAGVKAKDLLMMPARVALALQADGWWLRSDIIWAKPNPMPEAVTDRPTNAHEHVFLLTKAARYFYDVEAVKEAVTGGAHVRGSGVNPKAAANNQGSKQNASFSAAVSGALLSTRNLRNVWTIATAPYADAHFATFPPALVEPCIKAGCPDKCCPHCGAGWVRVVETKYNNPGNRTTNGPRSLTQRHETAGFAVRLEKDTKTLGWRAACDCPPHEPVPAVVLDPFGGAGTVGLVADRLGRDAILIELNPDYAGLADNRIVDDGPLFASVDRA